MFCQIVYYVSKDYVFLNNTSIVKIENRTLRYLSLSVYMRRQVHKYVSYLYFGPLPVQVEGKNYKYIFKQGLNLIVSKSSCQDINTWLKITLYDQAFADKLLFCDTHSVNKPFSFLPFICFKYRQGYYWVGYMIWLVLMQGSNECLGC